jgi:hypothetical protein
MSTFNSLGIEFNEKFRLTYNKRYDKWKDTDREIANGENKYKEYLTKNTKNIDPDDAKLLENYWNYTTEGRYLLAMNGLYKDYLSIEKKYESVIDFFDKISDLIEEGKKSFCAS